MVYLSGHGAMSSSNRDLYYYLTMDARTFDIERDPALKNVSTVSSQELLEWLREPVKTMPLKQVVILDTCAAGGATNDLVKLAEKRDIPPDQRRAIELLKDATGTFILMGSAADSASYEASRYGEGLLTYALLQGMRGESLDDGFTAGRDPLVREGQRGRARSGQEYRGIQKPVIAAPKGTGFPVALLTAGGSRENSAGDRQAATAEGGLRERGPGRSAGSANPGARAAARIELRAGPRRSRR